jgi:hypothetical protein
MNVARRGTQSPAAAVTLAVAALTPAAAGADGAPTASYSEAAACRHVLLLAGMTVAGRGVLLQLRLLLMPAAAASGCSAVAAEADAAPTPALLRLRAKMPAML